MAVPPALYDALVAPAVRTRLPPVPLSPFPTVTLIAPPLPSALAPDSTLTAPLFPDAVVPVRNSKAPLYPPSPALAVSRRMFPDDVL